MGYCQRCKRDTLETPKIATINKYRCYFNRHARGHGFQSKPCKGDARGHTCNSSVSLCGIRNTDGGCIVSPACQMCMCTRSNFPHLSANLRCHARTMCGPECTREILQPLRYRSACSSSSALPFFLQNSNVSIAVSFFACARFCTAFTSATDKRKVNCRLGHHFIAQTSSKPVGS